jgi:hypothetical protein
MQDEDPSPSQAPGEHGDDRPAPTALQEVLADNIRQLVWRHHDRTRARRTSRRVGGVEVEKRPSVNAWATAHGLDDKIMHRVLGPRSITIVTLEQIARAAGLEPWQLLVPRLNPEYNQTLASEF